MALHPVLLDENDFYDLDGTECRWLDNGKQLSEDGDEELQGWDYSHDGLRFSGLLDVNSIKNKALFVDIDQQADNVSLDVIRLFQQMEQTRHDLQLLLCRHPGCLLAMAHQFMSDMQEGVDVTDLLNLGKSDLDAVQGHYSVQGNVKQLSDVLLEDCRKIIEQQGCGVGYAESTGLVAIHFLPVFLLRVCRSVLLESAKYDAIEPFRQTLLLVQRRLHGFRQQLIVDNTGLVIFTIRKYKASGLDFGDRLQEGMVGLIKAVDRFDADREIRFSTYASYWIKQAISRLIIKQEKVVRLPVALAEKASTVFENMRSTYLKYDRWPTLAELKSGCNLPEDDIKLISSYFQATQSLDAATGDDSDGLELLAKLQQHQFSLPLDELIDNGFVSFINRAIESLPEKEATVLMLRFGLKNHNEMTLQAVADRMNVTRERIRQIQNEALKKLKQQFGFDLMVFLEPNDA